MTASDNPLSSLVLRATAAPHSHTTSAIFSLSFQFAKSLKGSLHCFPVPFSPWRERKKRVKKEGKIWCKLTGNGQGVLHPVNFMNWFRVRTQKSVRVLDFRRRR